MRKIVGIVCMIIGAVLLLGAFTLVIYNVSEVDKAEKFGEKTVSQLKEVIEDSENHTTNEPDSSGVSTETGRMADVEIDGYSYIGYLSIPAQGLNLPVMSDWDYSKLKISPCRYSGSVIDKNLVLIAHNYSSHFGRLDQLQFEDEVLFTDVRGVVTTYSVVSVDVVPPTSAEEVTKGDFDLALVTCTYSGKTRLVIYCDEKS